MNVAAIRIEINDRIPDDLAWTMVRDVAAASSLVHIDPVRREGFSGGEEMGAASVAANTESDDVRMLDQQQQIADAIRAAFFNERSLEGQRLRVRHQAQSPNFDRATQLTHLIHATCLN
jgi:hypothetical protein